MTQLKYYSGGTWVTAVVGAQGTQGSQGAQGYQGAQGATPSFASPTFTGTITATGGYVVTQTGGVFSTDDDETMTIMGAWI
jgi:hypothetical protein